MTVSLKNRAQSIQSLTTFNILHRVTFHSFIHSFQIIIYFTLYPVHTSFFYIQFRFPISHYTKNRDGLDSSIKHIRTSMSFISLKLFLKYNFTAIVILFCHRNLTRFRSSRLHKYHRSIHISECFFICALRRRAGHTLNCG